MLTPTQRANLNRVVAVINRKGGVGKTRITSNLAGQVAAAGRRVLVIDLDDQGNLGLDLGYFDHEEYDDRGKALFQSLVVDEPLVPVQNVRPNLDVLPAGGFTTKLETMLMAQSFQGRQDTNEVLAKQLAEIAAQYELVLIDCPPRTGVIHKIATTAARWLLVPADLDEGAALGLEYVLEELDVVRQVNPTLGVLGVVMIPVPPGAHVVAREQREILEGALASAGESAPVFKTTIRDAVKAATQARRRGQLVSELARDKGEQAPWYQRLKTGGAGEQEIARSAEPLAGDFRNLTVEVLQRLADAEKPVAKTRREQKEMDQ